MQGRNFLRHAQATPLTLIPILQRSPCFHYHYHCIAIAPVLELSPEPEPWILFNSIGAKAAKVAPEDISILCPHPHSLSRYLFAWFATAALVHIHRTEDSVTRIKALWSICNTWINDGGCRYLLIEKDFSENLCAYLLIIRGYRARAIATYIYIISPQMRPQQRLS